MTPQHLNRRDSRLLLLVFIILCAAAMGGELLVEARSNTMATGNSSSVQKSKTRRKVRRPSRARATTRQGRTTATTPATAGPRGPIGPDARTPVVLGTKVEALSNDVSGQEQREKIISDGGVLNGRILSKPMPPYPRIAKAARAQGVVTVQVVVDEEGKVISAKAVSGHPLLLVAAVSAAREARFSPTLLGGQPVKVAGVITYNFVLQ